MPRYSFGDLNNNHGGANLNFVYSFLVPAIITLVGITTLLLPLSSGLSFSLLLLPFAHLCHLIIICCTLIVHSLLLSHPYCPLPALVIYTLLPLSPHPPATLVVLSPPPIAITFALISTLSPLCSSCPCVHLNYCIVKTHQKLVHLHLHPESQCPHQQKTTPFLP